MRPNNRHERQKGLSKMFLIVILVLSLLLGLVGGVLGALFFAKPGPQGEQGIQGLQGTQGLQGLQGIQGIQGEQGVAGLQGLQGPQGIAGVNGVNSVLQVLQSRNNTAQTTSGYAAMQWFNMSVFDHSMNMSVTVQQNSRIFVQFSGTLSMEAPGSMWIRILVDNSLNSTLSIISVGPPSAGTFRLQSHIEFLTNSLNSGQHRIEVQFLRESGAPIILDRTLTFMEIIS